MNVTLPFHEKKIYLVLFSDADLHVSITSHKNPH